MDWNKRYLEGDTPWDKGAPSPPLLDLLTYRSTLFPTKKEVLVPGCGTGHDVQALAQHDISVTGLDIAPLALQQARKLHDNSNITWLLGDLFDTEFITQLRARTRYSTIWEHTCFCAISPEYRARYVQALWDLLENDGKVVGVFFLDTGNPPGEGPPFCTDRTELRDLFRELFSLEWEGPPQQCYPGREGKEWIMIWRKLTTCLDNDTTEHLLC